MARSETCASLKASSDPRHWPAEFKRFPVVADGLLVGQISRFDVLRALGQLLEE